MASPVAGPEPTQNAARRVGCGGSMTPAPTARVRGGRRDLSHFGAGPTGRSPTWHAALAVVGSLVSRASPQIGAALLLAALLSVVVDALTGFSVGRLLTRERASQNVVSESELEPPGDGLVHLAVTANYDAGRWCGCRSWRCCRPKVTAAQRLT
jgi:hypothetical protein